MLSPEDRRWLSDLVSATVDAVNRRRPPPEVHDGTMLIESAENIRGVAVQLANNIVVYADNVTGRALLVDERVLVFMNYQGAFIVGCWNPPHMPHTDSFAQSASTQTLNSTTYSGLPGGAQLSNFHKYRNTTKLEVWVSISGINILSGAQTLNWGILVAGTTYLLTTEGVWAGSRITHTGQAEIIGLVAGIYNCTLQYKIDASAASLVSPFSEIRITVTETT